MIVHRQWRKQSHESSEFQAVSRKNVNTKWRPVRQTCKSMNFSRRKRAAACFLTAIGPVITEKADRKTIMNYHTRGQTRKTIIDYHEELLNDS